MQHRLHTNKGELTPLTVSPRIRPCNSVLSPLRCSFALPDSAEATPERRAAAAC